VKRRCEPEGQLDWRIGLVALPASLLDPHFKGMGLSRQRTDAFCFLWSSRLKQRKRSQDASDDSYSYRW
jgi:hypothetical protein